MSKIITVGQLEKRLARIKNKETQIAIYVDNSEEAHEVKSIKKLRLFNNGDLGLMPYYPEDREFIGEIFDTKEEREYYKPKDYFVISSSNELP